MSTPAAALAVVPTPLGALRLAAHDSALTDVGFAPEAALRAPADPLLALAARQIAEYFAGRRRAFDLPLAQAGTPFQRRVWAALRAIGFGRSRSYGELATTLGTSARAVGGACRANPWVLVVPCHRAVGARGALGGFMGARGGARTDLKRRLLAHEASLT
jgi:methylated-DNA-[protein]-cysteine S-methyltransferase